jgi:p-cumate 2,3-dioxygenase subunit beta
MTEASFAGKDATAAALRAMIEEFLYTEAALLDAWRLDEWLVLFTADGRYLVPTTDLPDGDPRKDLVFIDDDMVRLRARVERLKSRHGHREYPSSRTRRFVSNIRIKEDDGDIVATSSFLVYRFRLGESSPYIGWYEHRLKRVNGELKIHHRKAVLDMEALSEHGAVSIIL